MYNVYKNCEFKHTFEELYADRIARGDKLTRYRKYWNYFSEATTVEELKLLLHTPDRRTKTGKWVASMMDKHEIPYAIMPETTYKWFTIQENNLTKRESTN